ncbi:MAG: phosphopantothenoylcysteine decarboxylase [Planctomycetota bacterium]|nr:phosphopantothenoylcysteine decarboxylase [Planctomycetota bacterium]
MARIVITSGPTRQYLDPVRYLTNGSSGRMGAALAQATLELGHEVTIISGPVSVAYPSAAKVVDVITTQEMLDATRLAYQSADGLIGAAAPCDYMPRHIESHKLSKTGEGLQLALIETPDIIATLGASKGPKQWVVGFALETEDVRFRAIIKMSRKCCDMMVSNSAEAMNSEDNSVEVILRDGSIVGQFNGPKQEVARGILLQIQKHLVERSQ